MTTTYTVLLILILLPRLGLLASDGPISSYRAVLISGCQVALVLLAFGIGQASFLVLLVLVFVGVVESRISLTSIHYSITRSVGLLALVFLTDIASNTGSGLQFSYLALELMGGLADYSQLLSLALTTDTQNSAAIILGLLLLGAEANHLIRAVLHFLGAEPFPASDNRAPGFADHGEAGTDQKEYNVGRAIGILERWLLLFVMINTESLNAIGFIIAAKGLARFKQLDDRQFAEYMLVGTLLSVFLALIVGSFVKTISY